MPSRNTAAWVRITTELLANTARTDYLVATVSGGSQDLARTVRPSGRPRA